tara:strand:+ start:88 stop:813 length:726 start_codon:yes stop_codon:yes gene_type:complete
MAFTQKSKLTSSGLMNRMPGKAKLNSSSKTPFFQGQQEQDIEGLVVTERDATGGEATAGFVAGAPGTVSRERGTIDETFANITPEEMQKVTAEGFTADLPGYKQYVEGYNTGTLPSQRKNYGGEVTVTDATSGTKTTGYTYKGKARNIDPKWGKHYEFQEFTSETPTWREQKDKLKGSKRYRNFSDKKKKKVMDAYKKSFLIMNPGTNFVNRPSSTTRTLSTDTAGKDGSRDYSGLTELEN